jgi:hypothetical protein
MGQLYWRIFYDDGSTFSNADGPPEASPGYGVLAIEQQREGAVGSEREDSPLASQDFYIFRTDYDCWIEVHQEGLIDHLVTAAHQVRAVRAGRTVPRRIFKRVLHSVPVDPGRFYGN